MKVWIDLSNSPHPLLFRPISARLEELGHSVFVTARDNAQTVELGRAYWPDLEVIGGESPGGRVAKARVLAARIEALRRVARRVQPDVALSHNSYAQIVGAKLARVRSLTAMDYEFQPANHLAFRLADRVLLPEALRGSGVERQGAANRKTCYYPGFKEELYLGDFQPNARVLDSLRVNEARDRSIVVVRTPPSRAVYHRFGNPLFEGVLRLLGSRPEILCVVLPRHREQREAIAELELPSVVMPAAALDTRSLMYNADLVIGAGGTMTREAALLGVPVVSVFAGKVPAVDARLIEQGLMRRAVEPEDALPTGKSCRSALRALEDMRGPMDTLVEWFADQIFAVTLADAGHLTGQITTSLDRDAAEGAPSSVE